MDHGLPCNYNYSKTVCQGFTKFSPAALGAPYLSILLMLPCSHLLPRQLQWLWWNLTPVAMWQKLLENGMSGLQEIITGSIWGTFCIYPVNLNLLAFTLKEATMSFSKFGPRCHVTKITRKWYIRFSPNLSNSIVAPLAISRVNFVCTYSFQRKLHRLGWSGTCVAMWIKLLESWP